MSDNLARNREGDGAESRQATLGSGPNSRQRFTQDRVRAYRRCVKTIVFILLAASLGLSVPRSISAESPGDIRFTLTGRAAGPVRSVAVQGRYAYVGVGYTLFVFDVAPRRPRLVSESPALPSPVESIAVTGHYAYIVAGEAGLFVYDITAPSAPFLAGSSATPGLAQDVDVVGNYAYVSAGTAGLRVVDVSDATSPVEVGFHDGGFESLHLDVEGTYAYVTTSPSGLRVINVADPATPVEIGATALDGSARGIAVRQQHAYVAAGSAGLRVVDISDPRQPHEVGSSTKQVPENAYDVALAGRRAYVADRTVSDFDEEFFRGGLRVVDVSSPARPIHLGALRGDVSSVTVQRGRAYVAQFGDVDSFDVVSVENPASPERIATYSIPPEIGTPLVASGAMLYTADDRLRQFDLSDPARPRLTWRLELPTDTYFKGQLTALVIDGTYAYVGGGTSGLHVVDLTDPARPRRSTTLAGEAYEVAVRGNLAFVSELYDGIRIVDITNPRNPRVVGRITGEWSTQDIQAVGDYLYVANYAYPEDSALLIYDVRNPAVPVLTGSYSTGDGSSKHVAIAGNYVYLTIDTIDETLLSVVDVSDPTAPRSVAALAATPNPVSDIALADSLIYLTIPAIPGGGVRVVDISDPVQPYIRGEYSTPGEFATSIALLPGKVVALGSSEGLIVLRETVPVAADKAVARSDTSKLFRPVGRNIFVNYFSIE
jgi:hypothetical protein